ncbi:HTH domain-containing protein [Micromonospora sp. NPDC050200]|uniref:HTH domain-containing protein n=1 Tax=Micromonospora sp. NPDC050200 TaxID=3155664 RepID=UPI0033F44D14
MVNTSARLLRLLSLLSTRQSWTCADLSAQLEITERTVRRDIARLREMHATGDYTIAELMEVFAIGRATVYRVLDRTKTTGTTDAETPR